MDDREPVPTDGPDFYADHAAWSDRQRERMGVMSNPGAKQFQQVHLTIAVWADPETSDSSAWAVADNVDVTARNAIEAAMKEIEAPDHGIEVVVR